jgi:hypothetical protein
VPRRLYPLCFVPFERKDRKRERGPIPRGTKDLRPHANSFSSRAVLSGKAVWRQADNLPRQCPQRNRHESSPRLASYRDAYVQPQPQKKVARAYRIKGSIILYRSPARNVFNAERSPLRAKPWWSMVFGAPLFLRTLLRLVFVCPHRHRGPPITMRESIPSSLPGCRSVDGRGTYITCLDCGQRFAYNHKSRRLVDFWGVRDAEALAGVRRRVYDFFSPLRGLAARVGMLNMRIPIRKPVRSVHRLGVLTKGH